MDKEITRKMVAAEYAKRFLHTDAYKFAEDKGVQEMVEHLIMDAIQAYQVLEKICEKNPDALRNVS